MQLTTEMLAAELFSEAISAKDSGFLLTKALGTVERGSDGNGEPLPMPHSDAQTQIEMNAAAVRMLGERYPDLKIKYPQTVISEKTVMQGEQKQYFTETRTDAVIQVPDSFVQVHTGAAFRQLLAEEWQAQLAKLTEQIVKRLRRHELRTARMFGENPDAAAASFRVTEDTAESEIWTVQLSHCGFYPLQWDGEICGMALLLAEQMKAALAEDCGTLLETAVRRDPKRKCCTVVVYYSIKQD